MEWTIYLFKVNVAIIVLYGFYNLFFQRDTFFTAKRFALIGLCMAAILFPFISFPALSASPETINENIFLTLPVFIVNGTTGLQEQIRENPAINPLLVFYSASCVLLLIYFLTRLSGIFIRICKSKLAVVNGIEVRIIKNLTTPFSFLNVIFIDPDKHNKRELEEIMIHEYTHINQLHSLDVIFIELMCILCWFNPFIWLIKKEIRMNLEYLADQAVLSKGYNSETYQLHLLQLSYHKPIAGLQNNFIFSPLKKRIKMMNKQRSSKRSGYKYILSLPCLLILFALINMQCQNEKGKSENEFQSKETIESTIENIESTIEEFPTEVEVKKSEPLDYAEAMPEFPGGDKALMNFLSQNITYPPEAVEKGIQGTVVCRFVVDEDGNIRDVTVRRSLDKECDKEAIRVIKSMPKWKPGQQGGQPVSVYYSLPIRYRLQ